MAFRLAMSRPVRFAGVLSLGGAFPRAAPCSAICGRATAARVLAVGRDSSEYPAERSARTSSAAQRRACRSRCGSIPAATNCRRRCSGRGPLDHRADHRSLPAFPRRRRASGCGSWIDRVRPLVAPVFNRPAFWGRLGKSSYIAWGSLAQPAPRDSNASPHFSPCRMEHCSVPKEDGAVLRSKRRRSSAPSYMKCTIVPRQTCIDRRCPFRVEIASLIPVSRRCRPRNGPFWLRLASGDSRKTPRPRTACLPQRNHPTNRRKHRQRPTADCACNRCWRCRARRPSGPRAIGSRQPQSARPACFPWAPWRSRGWR